MKKIATNISIFLNIVFVMATIISLKQNSELLSKVDGLKEEIAQVKNTNDKLFSELTSPKVRSEEPQIFKKEIAKKEPTSEKVIELKEGTGPYYVMIGSAINKQEAQELVKLAKKRGFTYAKYYLPYKSNVYYGVAAGSELSLEQAYYLLKEAKRYYPDSWIWQPH